MQGDSPTFIDYKKLYLHDLFTQNIETLWYHRYKYQIYYVTFLETQLRYFELYEGIQTPTKWLSPLKKKNQVCGNIRADQERSDCEKEIQEDV